MTSYMNVSVDASSIAREMRNDTEFAYDVLSELAYYLEGDYQRFADNLFKDIFENDNYDILELFSEILKQFEHLKENHDE
jgi:hypothetical protein